MSLVEINSRLDMVSELLESPILKEEIVSLLRRTFDSLRLVQKFSFGRGDADDLIGLSKTIQVTRQVAALLEAHNGHHSLKDLRSRMDLTGPIELSDRILDAIDEDKVMQLHDIEESEAAEIAGLADEILGEEGETLKGIPKAVRSRMSGRNGPGTEESDDKEAWIMRRSASPQLSKLHGQLDNIRDQQTALEARLREQLDAHTLTLKWTPGLGHIVHLRGRDVNKSALASLDGSRSVRSSKSTQSFYLPEWTRLGTAMEGAKLRIQQEEHRLFSSLRQQVVLNLIKLRRNAAVLDELDVACSFATLAKEQNLVRPILHSGKTSHIIGGRHPVVEAGLAEQGRNFTANDLAIGSDTKAKHTGTSNSPASEEGGNDKPNPTDEPARILLITGPNMGGKSTYLRQSALLSLLAQTGSFLPCSYASLGLVDKLFSRVGSADNLYADQSTFMVEMLETADILRQATDRSFVIMDEVGRGTTPEDGIAVGYACLEYLYRVNGCRTLFATHFHTLADMTKGWDGVACWCTDVAEGEEGGFAFVHKLRQGVSRESHALKVARLAGLPEEAVETAKSVLEKMRGGRVK